MKLISHRCQIDNLKPYREETIDENSPTRIVEILAEGYDCEIDVRMIDNKFYLGHDTAECHVIEEFLMLPGLWLHCKNVEALLHFKEKKVNCFWHQNDDYAILLAGGLWQKNLIWTTKYENNYNVIVMDTTGDFLKSLNGAVPKIFGYCCNNLQPMKNYLKDTEIKYNLNGTTTISTGAAGWSYTTAGAGGGALPCASDHQIGPTDVV